MAKKNILISAYSFAPHEGSEPGIGFNTTSLLAKHFNVTALVAEHYKKRCEKFPQAIPPNLDIHYIKIPILSHNYEKRGTLYRTAYYYLWQFFALKYAKKLHAKKKFALAHHVTFTKLSIPSLLFKLKIPLIFGTCGGAETTPKAMLPNLNLKNRIKESLRLLSINLTFLDPFARIMFKKSQHCLATTAESYAIMQKLGAKKVTLLTSVGLDSDEIKANMPENQNGKQTNPANKKTNDLPAEVTQFLRTDSLNDKGGKVKIFVSCGRPLYWKGFDLAIKALKRTQTTHKNGKNFRLIIICFGEIDTGLKKLTEQLSITEQVLFVSKITRSQVFQIFKQATCLLHPSYHDSGGFVIAEAQAMQLPVICLKSGCPPIILGDQAGIKIEPKSPEYVIEQLCYGMIKIADNGNLQAKMGRAGKDFFLKKLSWDDKINVYKKIYQEIL